MHHVGLPVSFSHRFDGVIMVERVLLCISAYALENPLAFDGDELNEQQTSPSFKRPLWTPKVKGRIHESCSYLMHVLYALGVGGLSRRGNGGPVRARGCLR